MRKSLIFLIILMFISFLLSAMFFFTSGVFDFEQGYVTSENAKDLNTKLNNFLSINFNGKKCEITEINQNINYSLNEISNLDISSISTDLEINVVSGNEAKFKLSGTGCDHKLLSTLEEDNLKIYLKYPTYKPWFSGINTNLRLDVYLPEEYENKISINSVSGEISVRNINSTECSINSVSGEIELENVFCNNSHLKTTSGEINQNKGYLDQIKTISGDVDLGDIEINKDSRIETVSGEVKILHTKDSNFKIVFNTVSGESEGKENYGTSQNNLVVKTTSGNLQIY